MKKAVSVSGPSLPIYMVIIRNSFPEAVSPGVKPVESPTVPKAEVVSKSRFKKGPGWVISRKKVIVIIKNKLRVIMGIVLSVLSGFTARLKKLTEPLEVNLEIIFLKKIAAVVVFIPPAVEPGDPPMNIRPIRTKRVAGERLAVGMVLKPAVRLVTDWK